MPPVLTGGAASQVTGNATLRAGLTRAGFTAAVPLTSNHGYISRPFLIDVKELLLHVSS
jgi:hypothetical protein